MESVIYIAGPMTGIPEYNYPAFEQAKKQLETLGYTVRSPHDIDYKESEENPRGSLPYTHYIKCSLQLLLTCDAIALLPGWTNSKGAIMEVQVAEFTGMDCYLFMPDASFPLARCEIYIGCSHDDEMISYKRGD